MASKVDDLQQMVLHHVANRAYFLVEGAAALHAEVLRHGDLHVLNVFAVPDRLEKRVGEAEVQNVLHGFLAQIVIDAENRGLIEYLVQGSIERLRAVQIPAKGLLDDDPSRFPRIRISAAPVPRCRTCSAESPR